MAGPRLAELRRRFDRVKAAARKDAVVAMKAAAEEIVAHCRANLASFKCPRHVVFRDLPMTSTGKVQKYVLRDWAKKI